MQIGTTTTAKTTTTTTITITVIVITITKQNINTTIICRDPSKVVSKLNQ
jgi:hypothetical protein